jgi:hypothetical protein
MEMHDPAHPGEIVREECLKPLGLTVTVAAEALGVTRKALSDLLNGHTGVSPEYGNPAGEGVRQHGRHLAADADAAGFMGSPSARGQDQGEQALCNGRTLLNIEINRAVHVAADAGATVASGTLVRNWCGPGTLRKRQL